MKILVTGCSGFLGKKLVTELLKKNLVIGFDIKKPKIKNINFKFIKGNLCNFLTLKKKIKKLKKIDLIIHTAAAQPIKKDNNIEKYIKNNFIASKNLIEVSRIYSIKKFIYCSSFSVYGLGKPMLNEKANLVPNNFYGLSKQLSEIIIKYYSRKYSIHCIIFRFDGIYGKGQNLPGFINDSINLAKKNKAIEIFNNGKLKRDNVYVLDAVKAIINAIKKLNKFNFEIFNIGGGEPKNSLHMFNKIKKEINSKSKIKLIKNKNQVFRRNIYLDISKAKKKINYKPGNFEENLKKILDDKKNI